MIYRVTFTGKLRNALGVSYSHEEHLASGAHVLQDLYDGRTLSSKAYDHIEHQTVQTNVVLCAVGGCGRYAAKRSKLGDFVCREH